MLVKLYIEDINNSSRLDQISVDRVDSGPRSSEPEALCVKHTDIVEFCSGKFPNC